MQLNTQHTDTTFTGAFRFKPNNIDAQKQVQELFTQGRQVFSDIIEKGDMVIVVRDHYDKRIGKYIQENGVVGVEYIPTINTKSGLDPEEPEKLAEIFKNKTHNIITNFEEMIERISKQKRDKRIMPKTLNIEVEVDRIANALRLNIENPKVRTQNEYMTIRDEAKKRTIESISHSWTYYVYVKPDSISQETMKYIIDGKGQQIRKVDTPDEIFKFFKEFRRLKAENLKTK